MLAKVIIENSVKKIQALTADTGAGAPVGSLIAMYKKSSPSGYLYCDGSTFDETKYPALYQYLGSNVLPDYREFALVGAEENTTDVYDASTNPTGTIHDHDVYTEGQAKDDQLQNVTGEWYGERLVLSGSASGAVTQIDAQVYKLAVGNSDNYHTYYSFDASRVARTGTTTHGKRKAVYFYIKATSGLTENQQENVLNTINDNLSYSTEEHPTGKKWIDGKPIYSKVIDCGALPNNTETFTDLNIQNLATVVNLKGMANNGAGTFLPLPYIDASLTNCVQMSVANNKISIITNGNRSTFSAVAIVEYTKTTN